MQRVTQFAFRVNDNERRAITDLAAKLQRSQSDAVRFVVIEAVKQLTQPPADLKQCEPMPKGGNNAATA
jgi:hypothetical protein